MYRGLIIAAIVGLVAIAGLVALGFWWRGASQTAPARLVCLTEPAETGPHAGMVWIPSGAFQMGDDVYPEEGPLRTQTVAGFWMDRTEVTNEQFEAFVDATHYVTIAEHGGNEGAAVFVMPSGADGLSDVSKWWKYVPGANWRHPGGPDTSIEGREHFPVVALTYADIEAYAKWKGHELPTEAEWEWAARGGAPQLPDHEQPRDANTWQGVFPIIDTGEDGFAGLAPVGCFKPNGYGLRDMIGNVWEWTSDEFRGHEPKARVIKGGSYLCARNYCMRYRAGARQPQEEDLATSHVGFRTILRAPDGKGP